MKQLPRTFFLIRYSFLSATGGAWALGRTSKDREEYEQNLFAEHRLRIRELLFSRFTLPTLAGQLHCHTSDFRVLILLSDRLPPSARTRLENLCARYDFISICEAGPSEDVVTKALAPWVSQLSDGSPYLTVRLDDDDGLAKNFVAETSKFLNPAFEGFAISYGRGCLADIRGVELPVYRRFYQLKMSVGMGFVSVKRGVGRPTSVFEAGNHRLVDEKVPTIISSKDPMFLHTKHAAADTFDQSQGERLAKLAPMERAKVESLFALAEDAFNPLQL